MKLPPPGGRATARFEELRPTGKDVTVRKMFGQPAAFVRGNLFFGVYGAELFVRLSERDAARALEVPGARRFEPMPGRPMKSYVVLPAHVRNDRTVAREWVETSLAFGRSLPAKPARPGPK